LRYNPTKHHRRSIRLKDYDYAKPGGYFITLCTQNRDCLFGDVINDQMILNDAGKMVAQWVVELQNKFLDIRCHTSVVMPNHFHGIVINVGADRRVCPRGEHIGSPLHKIVQWFKTMTTNAYIRGVKNQDWKSFDKKLWQRNYWEHVIRNEKELNRIQNYIIENPLK